MINTDRRRKQNKPFSRGHSPSASLISPGSPSNLLANGHIKPLSLKTASKSPKTTVSPNVPSSLSREISQDDDDEDETDGDVKVIIDGKNTDVIDVTDEQVKTPNKTEESDYFTHINNTDEEEEEVRVTSSQGVHVARVVQGHVVDDDYPEQDDETTGALTPSDCDPSMFESFHSHIGEHALGGSGDEQASDDEDEHFAKQEKLITLVGDVKGKTAIILDDMIDHHGSFVAAAEHCVINCGAKQVYVVATHGIFSNNSLEELEKCPCIDQIVVTNTYPISVERRKLCRKLTILDISPILAECIRRNHHGESISALFEQQQFF